MTPSGELTLYDLLIALGERVGQTDQGTGADNRTVPSEDPQSRDRLVRAINAGRREVYTRMPDGRCFEHIIEITTDPAGTAGNTIGGDSSKYRLNHEYQTLAGGRWTWKLPGTAGYGQPIQQVHQSDLAALHQTANPGPQAWYPTTMALASMILPGPEEANRRTTRFLWIYPKPDKAYVLSGQVRVMFSPLTENDDLEPMGQEHLETILTFAERDFKVGRIDADEWKMLLDRCETAMAVSQAIDNARGAQSLGVKIDPEAERDSLKYRGSRYATPRAWPDRAATVDTVSGVSVL